MQKRPRRLRASEAVLGLCEETVLKPSSLILPIFLTDDKGVKASAVKSMPEVSRHSIESALKVCEALLKRGVKAVAPFPAVDKRLKSLDAAESFNPNSLANRAAREIKKRFPEICIFADVALDPYTSHGHDGILSANGNTILNDPTVEVLAKMALSAAQAGADFVAPSDMMDGRIGFIRQTLDAENLQGAGILAYSAKYASAFYGPFRDAIGSAKKGAKPLDKRSYQLNPANVREALKEAALDEAEGADILMVKPAGAYLDIIAKVRAQTALPVAAYQVSGEYAMIAAAAQKGWLDFEKTMRESLLGIKRAGADIILSYWADRF